MSISRFAAGQRASHPIDRVRHGIVEQDRVQFRSQLAGLDPAHIEQVRHESIEVDGLAIDRRRDRRTGVVAPLDETAGGRADRGNRRPQVVGHGVEQRALERLALAGHLDARGVSAQPIALEGLPELVRGRCQEPRLLAARRPERSRAKRPHGPERPIADLDRRLGMPPGRARDGADGAWRGMQGNPARGLVALHPLEQLVPRRASRFRRQGRRFGAEPGVRNDPFQRAGSLEPDPDPGHPGLGL